MEYFKRIGVAFTAPRDDNGRQDQYGLYQYQGEGEGLYTKYEGYKEKREDGVWLVGLPLGGDVPRYLTYDGQPLIKTKLEWLSCRYSEFRFFEEPNG